MAAAQTTVPVKGETLRRLRGYKTGRASFDDVLNELMDEIPTDSFIQEHLRRLQEEEKVPWASVKARLKL